MKSRREKREVSKKGVRSEEGGSEKIGEKKG